MNAKQQKPELSRPLSRREFLKKSAMGAVGISLTGSMVSTFDAFAGTPVIKSKSKVVLIRNPKVIDGTGKIHLPLLQEMVDRAITTFTDKSTIIDAWQEIFTPEEIIGLKVNANMLKDFTKTDWISHYPSLALAIISGCNKAGIKNENFVIWDRSEAEVYNARYDQPDGLKGVRLMGTKKARREPGGIGYSSELTPVGEKSTHVSRLLTEVCDSLINVPVLKDHSSSGVTGCMKNHYGSIDNPSEFHDNGCTNPGIPEINNIPVIRKKQKLIIADILLGAYNGGPRWRRDYFWPYGGIVIGTDPVAVDWVLMKLLDEKRIAEDMQPVEPRATHLGLSDNLGLGNSNPEMIDLVKIEMG